MEFEKELIDILNIYTENGWVTEPLDGDEVDRLTEHLRNRLNLINGNITKEEYDDLEEQQPDKYDIAKEVRIEDFKNAMECMDFSPDDYTEKELTEMFDTFEDLLANDDTYNSIYSETLYYVLQKKGK